jgi:hypothetical protein
MSLICYQVYETHMVVWGKTYYTLKTLKTLGGSWDSKTRVWTLPLECNTPFILEGLEREAREGVQAEKEEKLLEREIETGEKKRRLEFAETPEGRKALFDASRQQVKSAYESGECPWMCCANCSVVDWKRRHTSCITHEFRVNGSLFTSD